MTEINSIRPPRLTVRSQGGVSLVEIMVALLLSLILFAGVGQIYLGSNQTYRLQEGQARLQENARYAFEVLSRDIRRTGSLGCLSVGAFHPTSAQSIYWERNNVPTVKMSVLANGSMVAPNNDAIVPPANVVVGSAVSGGDNATGGGTAGTFSNPNPVLSSGNALSNVVIKGTDAITVQFAESCGGITTANANAVDTALASLPNPNSCTGALLISDCKKAHIFRDDGNNSGVDLRPILPEPPPAYAGYAAGSEVMRFRAYTYYIRMNPAGEPALYRYDNSTNASDPTTVEIVEGIENMQITYGVDTNDPAIGQPPDGLADAYVTAGNVTDWARVVSVRIDLTVRSVGYNADNLTSRPNPVRQFNGADLTDRRLVKNFSISIKLR